MFRKLLYAASASLALGGCDYLGDAEAAETPAAVFEPIIPQREADPEAFHSNIQSAMEEVPPELRPQFQLLFACEIRKNNQRPNPQPVDAKYLRALTEYLKQNPTAGSYCRQQSYSQGA